jgi:hypothetical protein
MVLSATKACSVKKEEGKEIDERSKRERPIEDRDMDQALRWYTRTAKLSDTKRCAVNRDYPTQL